MTDKIADWKQEILKKWARIEQGPFKVSDDLRDRLARDVRGEVLYREPMSRHSSIRIGGPADVFITPRDAEDAGRIVAIARELEIPYMFHGAGSNTLVRDGGIRGLVIAPPQNAVRLELEASGEDYGDIRAGAGMGITAFVNFATENGLTGAETLVGIPGTIGGAVMMNAGARGREIKDIVREIEILETDGQVVKIPREKLDFEYRHLKIPKTVMVLSALFRLEKGGKDAIAETVREYQKKRADTQPLNFPSLGSVFKNPQSAKKNEVLPKAGQLIEELGLKNVRVGGARISEKHANFIVNERQATARDVQILIGMVRDRVKEKTGIVLETEVKTVGEDA